MTLQLISKPECPFCWKVKLALAYLQMDYELVESKQPDREVLSRYSPQQSVPILRVDDQALWDSMAIIYYLEDLVSHQQSLFPGDREQRSDARHLDIYGNSVIGPKLREVVFEKRDKPRVNWDLELIESASLAWRQTWDWLEARHSGAEHFVSSGFSLAECSLLPRFALAEHYGVAIQNSHPKLYQWYFYWKQQAIFQHSSPWN